MYGLPETYDPSFLKGKDIERVCFATHQVNLYLEGNVWIQIEGKFRVYSGVELLEVATAFPLLQSSLLRLVGKKVADVLFLPKSGDIEIRLEDGMKLLIEGDSGPYESYRLFDGRNETIV